MQFYAGHRNQRDYFEILAFHDPSVKTLPELRQKLKPIIQGPWKGQSLPFPILLDATEQTHRTNWGIRAYPTVVLIDPEGRLLEDEGHLGLEQILDSERAGGCPLALSSETGWSAVVQSNRVRLSSPAGSAATVEPIQSGPITALALSSNARLLAAASRDRSLRIWDLNRQAPAFSLRGQRGTVLGLAFSPDNRLLASAGFDATRVWDLETRQLLPALSTNHFVSWSVAFSPDGGTLAAGGFRAVRCWEVATGRERCRIVTKSINRAVSFSPDGQTLAVGDGHDITLWQSATGAALARFAGPASEVTWLAWSPDSHLLASVSRGGTPQYWDITRREETAEGAPTALRLIALRAAQQLPEDVTALVEESWATSIRAGANASAYARALGQAERAVHLAPGNPEALRALGGALYRNGRYAEAAEPLARCDERLPRPTYWAPPVQRMFLVLAHRRAGHDAQARSAIISLWETRVDPEHPAARVLNEAFGVYFGPRAEEARELATRLVLHHPTAAAAGAAAGDLPNPELRQTVESLLPYALAHQKVQQANEQFLLKAKVLEQVEKMTANDPDEVRQLTREFASRVSEDPSRLNSAAWEVVSTPDLAGDLYDLALAQAERAYQLDSAPASGTLNTLGVAQYRAGQFAHALATLQKSRRLNSQGPDAPEDLAFIAMTQFHLGRNAEARKSLQRLRAAIQNPNEDTDSARFLREATALIGP